MINIIVTVVFEFGFLLFLEKCFISKKTDTKKTRIIRKTCLISIVLLSGLYLLKRDYDYKTKLSQIIEKQKNRQKLINVPKKTIKKDQLEKDLKLADLALNLVFTRSLYKSNLPKKKILFRLSDKISQERISEIHIVFIKDKIKDKLVLDCAKDNIVNLKNAILDFYKSIKLKYTSISMIVFYKDGVKAEEKVFLIKRG